MVHLSCATLKQHAALELAFRSTARLEPAGGPDDKFLPPTYAAMHYATEMRRTDGEQRPCVLVDSVQSQANRLERSLGSHVGDALAVR